MPLFASEAVIPLKLKVDEIPFVKDGVLFEFHTCLRSFASRKHQIIWDDFISEEWMEKYHVEIQGQNIRTLSPTANAAYIFMHLFFHFIREGVSLRQFCDWAMVLHHYSDEIDKERLFDLLIGLGLFDAYCAFGTILVRDLGIPEKEFPFDIEDKCEKWGYKILEDVFKGGNFGKLNHAAHDSWWFKMETMKISLRNSIKYYKLCPSEIGGTIPRLIKKNIRMWFS